MLRSGSLREPTARVVCSTRRSHCIWRWQDEAYRAAYCAQLHGASGVLYITNGEPTAMYVVAYQFLPPAVMLCYEVLVGRDGCWAGSAMVVVEAGFDEGGRCTARLSNPKSPQTEQ